MTRGAEIAEEIKRGPHWRVLIRPGARHDERYSHPSRCREVVEKHQVRLRGWSFPRTPRLDERWETGDSWVGAWSDYGSHLEYWRFYLSAQFVHLARVREVADTDWARKLRGAARTHLGPLDELSEANTPGFVSLPNLVYTIAEYFEFAARLCEIDAYSSGLELLIELNQLRNHVLTTDDDNWVFQKVMRASSEQVARTWSVQPTELLGESQALSLEAILWFLERFDWPNPPRKEIGEILTKFLAGKA